jgi:bifunctional oligoribonuclease and PAP phosphatase NrnA
VKVAVLFRELARQEGATPRPPEPPQVKVSLRAKGEVDVARLAASLGGGGHPNAAGVVIPGTLDEVRRRVLDAVEAAVAAR